MKKVLLTVCLFVMAVIANAQLADQVAGTYSGTLIVTITAEGESATADPGQQDVIVDKVGDNQMELHLNNFVLVSEGEPMPVGNITVPAIDLVEKDGAITFEKKDNISIENGDDPTYEGAWMGPTISAMPDPTTGKPGVNISMTGKVEAGKMTLSLDIPFAAMGMQIAVTYGGTNPNYTAIQTIRKDKVALTSSAVKDELSFIGIEGAVNYAVYNIAGNLVKKGHTTGSVNVSTLNSGIYLIKIGGVTMKFVKR